MDDKEMVKGWLSKLAANKKEERELSVLGGYGFGTCYTGPEAVQLYQCVRKVIGILGIPSYERTVKYDDGSTGLRIAFTYEGVEFFGLEGHDDGDG